MIVRLILRLIGIAWWLSLIAATLLEEEQPEIDG